MTGFSSQTNIVFDSSAKVPDGIFQGNTHITGAFHECIDVETPSLLNWENEQIRGFKYDL